MDQAKDPVRQVNVTASARKMQIIDRYLAREGITLVALFDRFITDLIRQEQDALRDYFMEEERRAADVRARLEEALDELIAHDTVDDSKSPGITPS